MEDEIYHVDTLVGDRWVDNYTFASLCYCLDSHLVALILVRNEWSNVGLDTTSAKCNDNDSSDIATK